MEPSPNPGLSNAMIELVSQLCNRMSSFSSLFCVEQVEGLEGFLLQDKVTVCYSASQVS